MTLNRTFDDALPLEIYELVEQATASQKPFADDSYILDQLQHCLLSRLERVAGDLPAGGHLLDAVRQNPRANLHRLFSETTFRSAIVNAHEQIVSGIAYGIGRYGRGLRLTDCSAIITAAARYLKEGGTDTPLQEGSLTSLGPQRHLGWIWSEEHPNDTYGSAFRQLLMAWHRALPCTPSSSSIETLTTGCRLLHELLPSLAPSALHHVQVIALVPSAGSWTGVASSSQFNLGGAIFLSESLGTPWWVAEHVLHEALHQKLYDFRHGHSLLEFDYGNDGERPVVTPWNPSRLSGKNRWEVWRVFAAFHVYVQLALLTGVAERRAPELEATFGPLSGMHESHRVRARACYLGHELKARCWDKLGPAGEALADWLQSLLGLLEPAPPPTGSTVHLYLDRYRHQTEQLEKRPSPLPDQCASLRQELTVLARQDLATTRAILRDLGARGELDHLDAFVAPFNAEEVGDRYAEIRRVIEACLVEASVDGYRMSESGEHDERVSEMVDISSDALFALGEGIPLPVAAAQRRAVKHGFRKSCDDGVGRFLAVLVAHLRPGAKVLEIGTGVGVGTAWITVGLGAHTDVDVLTVEVDEQLNAAARTYDWPSYVRLENVDGVSVLGVPDEFDLIFADAPPLKWEHLGAMTNALRPGGLLVFDDMRPSAQATEPIDTNIITLRQQLLNEPQLVTVDVDWSGGLMIATKRQ